MAITYVGAAGAVGTSVNLPAGSQAGDVAIVIAGGTAPAGWTQQNPLGFGMGWRVLQAGDTSTGVWTGTGKIAVVVYRGTHATTPISAAAPVSGAGSPLTIPALSLGTGTGTVAVVAVDNTDATSNLKGITASGLTNRTSAQSDVWYGVADTTSSVGAGLTYAFTGTNWVAFSLALVPAGWTFPVVAGMDTTSGTQTSNSSSWTLTYPTNIAAGDLLLLFLAVDGGSGAVTSFSDSADWRGTFATGTAVLLNYLKLEALGTESGSFTVTLNASEQGAWTILRIPAGTWDGTLGAAFLNGSGDGGVLATGTGSASSTPDPPSLDPLNWAAESTLWLAVMAADTSRTVSGYPSTFTNTGYLASGGSTGATLAWARLESAVASLDPGTFTISASDDWATATVAIRPNPTRSATFTADATTAAAGGSQTRTGTFSANAIVKRNQSGSFTANAVIKRPQSGSLTAGSIVKRPQNGSLSANAIIKRTQIPTLLADAAIKRAQSGSFTAVAWMVINRTGSFTAAAIINRPQAGSFSADAIIQKTITGGGNYREVVLADSPIAYWRLGEPSGTTAYDEIGDTDLTYSSGPVDLAQTGLIANDADTSVYIDTTIGLAKIKALAGNTMPAGSASGVTLECWAKFDSIAGNQLLVGWGVATLACSRLIKESGGGLTFEFFSGSLQTVLRYGWSPTAGVTYHLAATVDGSGNVSLYVDGSQLGTTEATGLTPATQTAGRVIYLGIDSNNSSSPFGGYLDEVAIYNAPLTGARIASHHAVGSVGGVPLDAFLLRPVTQTFTAAAWVIAGTSTVTGSFSADAIIKVPGGTTYLTDHFNRTVASGLGTSDDGHTYSGVATYRSVANGYATITNSITASIGETGQGPYVEALLKTQFNNNASNDIIVGGSADSGTFIQGGGYGRQSLNTLKAEWGRSNGSGWFSTAYTFTASEWWWARVRWADGSVAVRVWRDGDAESETWESTTSALIDADLGLWLKTTGGPIYLDEIHIYGPNVSWVHADAVIGRSFTQTVTAAAWVIAGTSTVTGSFTAAAIIKRAQAGSFTANAIIKRTSTGAFFADAILASGQQTVTGSFGADARLLAQRSGSFSASATIAIVALFDDFSRVVDGWQDLGGVFRPAYPSPDWYPSDPKPVGVDGSAGWAEQNYSNMFVGFPIISSGEISVSLRVPDTGLGLFNIDYDSGYVQFYVSASGYADIETYNETWESPSAVIAGQWYRFKFTFPSINAPASVALWKIGDPEPAPVPLLYFQHQPGLTDRMLLVRNASASSRLYFDDLLIRTSQPWWAKSNFVADATKLRTQTRTFTAAAWLVAQPSGSFTAAATISRAQAGSLIADAITRKSVASTISADARLLAQWSGSFSTDAIVRSARSGSFTSDAIIVATAAASITSNAITKATGSGSLSSALIILRSTTGSLSAAATIGKGQTGSFSAAATIARSAAGSITADAIRLVPQAGSFTATAIVARPQAGSFTAAAWMVRGATGSFTADASIYGTVTGSFYGAAFIIAGHYGFMVADAAITAAMSGATTAAAIIAKEQSGSFTAAVIVAAPQVGSLDASAAVRREVTSGRSLDAIVRRTSQPSLTTDAILYREQAGVFVADAQLAQSGYGTFTADAIIEITWGPWSETDTLESHFHLTADAVIVSGSQLITGAFSAGATIMAPVSGQVWADAFFIKGGFGFVVADAAIKAAQAGSFSAAAIIVRGATGSVTADAQIRRPQSGTLTADAVGKRTSTASFAADAVLRSAQTQPFTASALLRRSQSASFGAAAWITVAPSGAFTAQAVLRATSAAYFSADALVKRFASATVSADAYLVRVAVGSFTGQAVKQKTQSGSFSAAAVIEQTRTVGFGADAVLLSPQTATLTSDAWIRVPGYTFTADAWIRTENEHSFSADASISRSYTEQISATSTAATIAGTSSGAAIAATTTTGGMIAAASTGATMASTSTAPSTAATAYRPTVHATLVAAAIIVP